MRGGPRTRWLSRNEAVLARAATGIVQTGDMRLIDRFS
jgi:hypothetical protein